MKDKFWTIFEKVLTRYFLRKRYTYMAASNTAFGIRKVFTMYKGESLVHKIKGIRRGYYPGTYRKVLEGTHEGYLIPELSYYHLHPINGYFTKWIDDKITLRYILEPFKHYLPAYYVQLEKGKCLKLPDYQGGNAVTQDNILALLKEHKILACKPYNSTGGEGFYKLEFKDESFRVNNESMTDQDFGLWLSDREQSIITEYIIPEAWLREMNPYSTSTVRLLTVRTKGETHLTAGFLRFGTKKSGAVDNLGAGGIMAAVNVENGNLITKGVGNRKSNFKRYDRHPDTDHEIKGTIKNWDLLIKGIKEMGNYHPQLEFLGYDIAITDEGFKVVEINSLQDLLNAEAFMNLPTNSIYGDYLRERIDRLK